MVDEGGHKCFIVAFAPIAEVGHVANLPTLSGAENMKIGISKGIYIIKEVRARRRS